MRPRGVIIALTMGLLSMLLAGCSRPHVAQPGADGPTEIIFSHAKHVEEEVECSGCHGGLAESTALGKRHSPTKEACGECHEVAEKANCKMCHRDLAHARKLARRPSTSRLVFSHKNHAARAKDKGGCVYCHAPTLQSTSLAGVVRPQMKDCFSCHNHKDDYRTLQCSNCHQSLAEFPIKFVSDFNHEGNFLAEHGRWASAQSDVCASCHRQSFCADCHSQSATVLPSVKLAERAGRSFIHRGDWLGRHAVAARADPNTCARCHSPKTCDSCHSGAGVSATGRPVDARRSPHPADWMTPGSPNNHGGEARRHITQCAGCHDQGQKSICIDCHKSSAKGGIGLNPHPPGFDRKGKNSDRMCLFCH